MRHRFTVSECLWPETTEFVAFLEQTIGDVSASLLALVWQGYDLLCADLTEVDFSQPFDDLERNVTELLERRIRRVMTGFEPFEVQHGPYERASRKPAPAQPPQYDIAFSLRANERILWPLEAKVLPTDGAVSEYVREIREQYLTGRYAPFSREAAYSAAWRSAFRVDGDHDSGLMAIGIPGRSRSVFRADGDQKASVPEW